MRRTGKLHRPIPAVVAGAAALALGAGVAPATAQGAARTTAQESTSKEVEVAAKPKFQMPFACGTKWQLNTYGSKHNPAVDIVAKGNPGSSGKPVYSSAKGTVTATYQDSGSGNTIQINHGNGWFTAYYHLKDKPNTYVKKGQKVGAATKIGRIGTSGSAGGWAHLHYEQRYKASGNFTYEKHRKPVHFNGKLYTGINKEWKSVTSRNC
jgi:murein DD-endopeptidase MepM/ murein hydrolase activator NlpD